MSSDDLPSVSGSSDAQLPFQAKERSGTPLARLLITGGVPPFLVAALAVERAVANGTAVGGAVFALFVLLQFRFYLRLERFALAS